MSAQAVALLETLRNRFGERFSTSQTVREQHGLGDSHHTPAIPDAVVFAEATDEVADVVRSCAAEGVPVIAFGTGTSLEGHLTAVRGGISIDLSRMSQIVRVSAEDLDCAVQAAVTREQLAAINKKMVEYAISVDGTSTGEHGVGTGKIKYLRQEHGDAGDLMAVIKNAIDPKAIMNPGKILPD